MEQTTTPRVAEQIRAVLGRRALSRRWLARELDMPATSMNRRLCGMQPFSVDELVAVARALNVPAAALLPDDDAASLTP